MLKSTLLKAVAATALSFSTWASAQAVDLQFYLPGRRWRQGRRYHPGPDRYVCQGSIPDVNIEAVYAGSYQDTVAKAMTASRGGNPPQLSVILSVDMFTLIDEDADHSVRRPDTTDEDKEWLEGFYPAFMENSQTGGKTYGIPFQRSTPVLYWNKEAFAEAGLDPETPPATWEEMVEFGKKLVKKDASTATSPSGACASRPRASPIGCSRA
jgi:sn-glycerol 3-phosphate transport system substrate-binding protein